MTFVDGTSMTRRPDVIEELSLQRPTPWSNLLGLAIENDKSVMYSSYEQYNDSTSLDRLRETSERESYKDRSLGIGLTLALQIEDLMEPPCLYGTYLNVSVLACASL
jgi:hypothetical protein